MIPRVGMHQTVFVMMGDLISNTTCRGALNSIRHDGRPNCKMCRHITEKIIRAGFIKRNPLEM